jgi:hypothetical protein
MIRYFERSYFGPAEEGDILCDTASGRVLRVGPKRWEPATDAAICDGCGEVFMGFGMDPLPLRHRDCLFNGHLRRPSAADECRPVPHLSWHPRKAGRKAGANQGTSQQEPIR